MLFSVLGVLFSVCVGLISTAHILSPKNEQPIGGSRSATPVLCARQVSISTTAASFRSIRAATAARMLSSTMGSLVKKFVLWSRTSEKSPCTTLCLSSRRHTAPPRPQAEREPPPPDQHVGSFACCGPVCSYPIPFFNPCLSPRQAPFHPFGQFFGAGEFALVQLILYRVHPSHHLGPVHGGQFQAFFGLPGLGFAWVRLTS